MLRELWHSVVRVTSFVGKELREVVRRPGVLASLVLGPFLIMLLFGLGYTGSRSAFLTEIVVPPDSPLPRDPEFYADLAPGRIQVVGITEEQAQTESRLRNRSIGYAYEAGRP